MKTPDEIYSTYVDRYGKNTQGCCLVIADEIQKVTGGDIVAGELTWHGGSCRRYHWWVERNGAIIDPMGDWVLSGEKSVGRNEIHRDKNIFNFLLPEFEKYRIRIC